MTLANPPTPWDPTKLYDLAETVLGVCQQAMTDGGLVLPGLHYVCGNATPTGACDSLVVGWSRIGHGTPTGSDTPFPVHSQQAPRRAWLAIWVFRCISDVLSGEGEELRDAVVNPDAATADASKIMSDAYVLHKGMVIARNAGMFGNANGSAVVVEDFVPMAAQGGMSGTRGGLVVELS